MSRLKIGDLVEGREQDFFGFVSPERAKEHRGGVLVIDEIREGEGVVFAHSISDLTKTSVWNSKALQLVNCEDVIL